MRDLPLYLPDSTYIRSLTITPDFNTLSSVMQRAVVLLACSDDDALKIDGENLPTFLQKTTNAGAQGLSLQLSDIGNSLREKINSGDGVTDSYEETVLSAYFEVTVEGDAASVNLVLELGNSNKEETVIYKYE